MKDNSLQNRISTLETINDQLHAEIRYLDELLKEAGFEDGTSTLKNAAKELIELNNNDLDSHSND